MYENPALNNAFNNQILLFRSLYQYLATIQDETEDFYLKLFESEEFMPGLGKKIILDWTKTYKEMRKKINEANIEYCSDLSRKLTKKVQP
jgi:hypothetical protein